MVKNRFYSSLKKTIFKNKSLLKRKRERSKKNKIKNEEENIYTFKKYNSNKCAVEYNENDVDVLLEDRFAVYYQQMFNDKRTIKKTNSWR